MMVDSLNILFSKNTSTKNKNFFCGVVEGFYGRPWTTEQRKDLFQKMEAWAMDAYVYAPKDDYKHRAYWRDLYTVEEAEHLGSLIAAARSHNLTFYYALSPGLDITYSNPKEVSTLKRKLDQVASLGCRAFAILFDDIDTEMSEADKERFTSFAHAQVTITNDVVEHLGERASGGFLVCPTQYCSTRAVPSVSQSEYLRTLGTQLSPDVDVMWTGPKVISRIIDVEGVEEVAEVLKRKVVIWDNLHANDYDQKRLFLGPYSGRSPTLIPKLRGVLTNPNCEYGANFIAIHTLAQWSKCTSDHNTITIPSESSAISADIRLEQISDANDVATGLGVDDTINCNSIDSKCCNSTTSELCYHPRTAMRRALAEWLPEFGRIKAAQGGGIASAKPQPLQLQHIIPGIPLPSNDIDTVVVAGGPSVVNVDVTAVSAEVLPGIIPSVVSTNLGIIPSVNTCMGAQVSPLTTTTITCAIATSVHTPTLTIPSTVGTVITDMLSPITSAGNILAGVINTNAIITSPIPSISIAPITTTTSSSTIIPVMNSLVSEHKVLPVLPPPKTTFQSDISILPPPLQSSTPLPLPFAINGASTTKKDLVEPMECGGTTPAMSPTSSSVTTAGQLPRVGAAEDVMPMEQGDVDESEGSSKINDHKSFGSLTTIDLELMCELFYLPFEHGALGVQFLQDFHWLKSHALQLEAATVSTTPSAEAEEWRRKASKMEMQADAVTRLMRRLTMCANKELLYDLYAYVWEISLVIGILVSYVKWLGFSKGWKETFMSGEQEPWVFRGGLTSDLQRLIPVDSGNDLFIYKAPNIPTTCIYAVRPYISPGCQPQSLHTESEPNYKSDLEALYSVCLCTCGDMEPITKFRNEQHNMRFLGDVTVGPYLHVQPELTLVIEDDKGMVGYACAALDYKQFQATLTEPNGWLDEMKCKYPLNSEEGVSADRLAATELADCVHKFCNAECEVGGVYVLQSTLYPACVVSAVVPRAWEDVSVSKRLLTCLMAALRAYGIFGCHAVVKNGDTKRFLHYCRLGFQKLTSENIPGRNVMVRTF